MIDQSKITIEECINTMNNLKELLFLREISGIGPARIIKHYLPALIQGMELDELVEYVQQSETKYGPEVLSAAYDKAVRTVEQYDTESDIKLVTITDKDYPSKLKVLGNQRPTILFYKGDLSILEEESIAIVGTREPSEWSQKVEKQLTNKIIELSGRVIVSGLAQGCDTIAHRTCIDSGGKTVAVLPCGINNIFPEENRPLCDEIVEKGGLLITEYYPNSSATQYTFVARDTLIAAMSDATFVVECGVKSGTMHTVDSASRFVKRIGAYYCGVAEKGDYSGNKLALDTKGAVMVTDTDSLRDFLDGIDTPDAPAEPVQMSLFDVMG